MLGSEKGKIGDMVSVLLLTLFSLVAPRLFENGKRGLVGLAVCHSQMAGVLAPLSFCSLVRVRPAPFCRPCLRGVNVRHWFASVNTPHLTDKLILQF